MTITPEYQVVVTSVADLVVGDRVLRRATTPVTGKMSVDTVSRIQEAPPSRVKIMAGQNKNRRNRRGKYMEIVWNDTPRNLSYHHSAAELLLVTNFVEQAHSKKRTKKRFAWQ